jgi:hypothetical protein
MMRQHGAVWSVITFSPVLVMRLIADQLERKARLEHWFASFVESHLIKVRPRSALALELRC